MKNTPGPRAVRPSTRQGWKLNPRTVLAALHDVVIALTAWLAAFWLRFNLEIPANYAAVMWSTAAWVVPLQAVLFWRFGLYRGIWRYASLPDLKRIVFAVAVAAAIVSAIAFMLRSPMPRSVLILDPLLLMVLMGGGRLGYRAWRERRLQAILDTQREPVFVLGIEEAAVHLIRELAHSGEWRVVGVFDESALRRGRAIHGVDVLGGFDDLAAMAERLAVRQAIIAMPNASPAARRRAAQACTAAGLAILTVPSAEDLVSGKVTVSQVRNVELDDLLGRDPVRLDTAGLSEWIRGRTLMITGAGGSIGAELARQVARFAPGRLVLFELSEFNLYAIEQEFATRFPGLPLACIVGDVKNAARIGRVLEQWRPSVILHAAAYKHVPLMEDDNAWEAVLNNACGTHVLANAAIAHGVEKLVLISTDKAVNPTNVMGASKRLAEMICQALQPQASTRFVMVRFGNVLGSTGSVIPKFRAQIAAGGPVTVTHPEVRRYFMSIPEAAQLVLQAALMGTGGEIFAMDMGEPVRIADLARDLIRLSGFGEDEIRIVFTGLRPGEKLYEEVLANDENSLPTPHPKLRIAQARRADRAWLDGLVDWMRSADAPRPEEVRRRLADWVPEYAPADHSAQPAGQPASGAASSPGTIR